MDFVQVPLWVIVLGVLALLAGALKAIVWFFRA
jgi:hypothetical protein